MTCRDTSPVAANLGKHERFEASDTGEAVKICRLSDLTEYISSVRAVVVGDVLVVPTGERAALSPLLSATFGGVSESPTGGTNSAVYADTTHLSLRKIKKAWVAFHVVIIEFRVVLYKYYMVENKCTFF